MCLPRPQRDWRQVWVAVDGAAGGEAALHNTASGRAVIMALYRHVSRSSLLLSNLEEAFLEATEALLVKLLYSVRRTWRMGFGALLNTVFMSCTYLLCSFLLRILMNMVDDTS